MDGFDVTVVLCVQEVGASKWGDVRTIFVGFLSCALYSHCYLRIAISHSMGGDKKPYFGMTGTMLNVWITVACTTAMTLFGTRLSIEWIYYCSMTMQVMIRVSLVVSSLPQTFWTRWETQTPIFKELSFLYTISDGALCLS